MDPRTRYIIYAKVLFAVFVWGVSFIATKIALQNGMTPSGAGYIQPVSASKLALQEISPVTVVWLRFAMGVAILAAVVAARKQISLPTLKELAYFALLGFIGITFHQWLQSTGLITAQATTTAWIVATTPVYMAILGWLFLREKLGWLKSAGILLAAVGVILVLTKGEWQSVLAGRIGTPGDFLVLISAPNWALFSVLSRSGLKSHPPARMMLYVMGFGWLFTTALFLAGPGFAEVGQITLPAWLSIAFLGIFCSGVAYIFWYDALQVLAAAQLGVFLYLEPLAAMIVAAILLNEALLWSSIIGGAIILAGVWLVNRPPAAPARSRSSGV